MMNLYIHHMRLKILGKKLLQLINDMHRTKIINYKFFWLEPLLVAT